MNDLGDEITSRPSRPEDCNFAGELIYSTGRCFFDYIFGADRMKTFNLLALLYKKRAGIFSHRFSTVAENRGAVAGLVLVYDGWQRRFHALLNDFHVFMHCSPVAIVKMLYRDFYFKKFIKRIPHRSLYIAHLAVVPKFQGRGIGRLLLEHAIEAAKSSRYATCSLDVLIKNIVAVKLYQKMGFSIFKEIRHKGLEEQYQLEGQFRMIKNL